MSYELSRKMRKVAVQVQDLGQQLCWQLYIDNPGDPLGLGEFVHSASAALDPGVKQPKYQPYPQPAENLLALDSLHSLRRRRHRCGQHVHDRQGEPGSRHVADEETNDSILFKFAIQCPPAPTGFELTRVLYIDFHGAQVTYHVSSLVANMFTIRLTYANFGGKHNLPFDATVIYEPTPAAKAVIDKANLASKAAFDDQLAVKKEQLFYDTLRSRLKLVGQVKPRPQDDLREEERNVVFRHIIAKLYGDDSGWRTDDYHVASEMIRYLFDVDAMLYFVAPDWWRPRTQQLVSMLNQGELQAYRDR